jgi:TRAP-type C4-dicarboxylate transport system permease small subunit
MLATLAKRLSQALSFIAAAILAVMMFLTALDVCLRYFFNRPLAGAFELVGYMMAILVPFSIAYCYQERGHIVVDLFMERFRRKTRLAVDIITILLTMIFTVLIAWQNVIHFFEVKHSGLTSSVLSIPEYPFISPTAVAFATASLILLVRLLDSVSEMFST